MPQDRNELQNNDELRNDIATAARAFSRLGYVHAFGHVSQRAENSLFITPTRPPLATQQAAHVIEVDFDGRVIDGDAAVRPIEVFLHIGIYASREDVRAICHDVLRHRIGLTYEAEAENMTTENIITGILNAVEVP